MTHSWDVSYDNHSQNPSTWESGTDQIEADTMTVRDGCLKFINEGDKYLADNDGSPIAVYAPGYWTSAKRSTE